MRSDPDWELWVVIKKKSVKGFGDKAHHRWLGFRGFCRESDPSWNSEYGYLDGTGNGAGDQEGWDFQEPPDPLDSDLGVEVVYFDDEDPVSDFLWPLNKRIWDSE